MSIVSQIGQVINKMSVATAIDYFIVEREFANLLTAQKEYQVFIDAPLVSNARIASGNYLRTYQIKMLWLKKQPLGNTYEQHYTNAITVMRTLVKEFVLRINNEVSSVTGAKIFDTITTSRESDIINLFDQNTSGVLLEFEVQVIDDGSICTPNLLPAPTVFIFSDFTTVQSGATIRLGWIAFNVNTIEIDNGVGTVSAIGYSNIVINNTITFNATAINGSGTDTDSITITVGSGCDDATAVLRDSANNIISTTDIPSGDIVDIPAPNGTVTAVNSNNSFSQSQSVLSGGVANINLPDITVNESDGSTRTQPSNTTVTCIPVTPLAVDFSVDDATPDTNQVITFTDLTVGASSWVWNFGDGTTSTLQNPTKSYRFAGTYTVTLAAENGGSGGIETKVGFIVVTLQSLESTSLLEGYNAPVGATPANLTLVSGAVSEWAGKLLTYNINQSTPTNRPLYNATGFTAPDGTVYGTVLFDGLNDVLVNLTMPRTSTGVIYMVFRHVNIASVNSVILGSPTAIGHTVSNQVDNPAYRMQNGLTADTRVGYIRGEWFLAKFQFNNAGNAAIRINDVPEFALANTGANTPTGFNIGATGTGTSASNIEVLQVDVFSLIPTLAVDNERVQFYDSKFGICNV